MRVAKEANLYGVWIKIVCSDGLQVDVRGANGDPFHVLGYYGLTAHRWKVTKCITRNAGRMVYGPGEKDRTKGKGKSCGKETIPTLAVADLAPPPPDETFGDAFDDLGGILEEEGNPDKAEEESNPDEAGMSIGHAITIKTKKAGRMKSPIKTKWIVPLVLSAISATPNLPSKEITALLKPYIIDMFLMSALIQKVRQSIRNQVFGDPDKNVTYVHVLRDLLDTDQHDFDIYVKTPIEVKKRLLNVVIEKKMNSVKKDGKMMVKAEKLQYLEKWELANMEMLDDVGLGKDCGADDTTAPTFLCGIFLSISAAKNTVPLLQTVYQADAAHMNFGKYTLYSCYGITANCNAFPVAFGIIFGNEDKDGWERFWKFASTRHPCLNHAWVTIITDQQKGSIEAMAEVVPKAVNFFCSYHRGKNILTNVKGGKGVYSAFWYYNLLLGCG